ncbi:MAG: YjgN family protein [Halieaceae bacterium]|nr:YjgN family protein [Halieaceae bacterium]
MNQPINEQLTAAAAERDVSFEFTGTGGEFFRIWIVNLFLTIITVGIYSAWAKVRTASYFYSHTHLDGNSFRYLAKPITILKGRLIAIAALVVYTLANQYYPLVGALMSVGLLVMLPWLITRSLRFNAFNSAYRNVRFDFTGDVGGATVAFLAWPVLGVLSLGLLMPLVMKKQNEYMVNNFSYGTQNLSLEASTGSFYKAFLVAVGLGILVGVASALAAPLSQYAPLLGATVAYLLAFAYMRVQLFNLVYGGTSIGDHRLQASMTTGSFLGLTITNILLIAVTLGLAYPVARVRAARYKAGHLGAVIAGNLDNFVAAESERVSAVGEELGDMLDLDIGL